MDGKKRPKDSFRWASFLKNARVLLFAALVLGIGFRIKPHMNPAELITLQDADAF